MDYKIDPEAARLLIDGWVEKQTEGRIPELLKPQDVDTLTRLVLVNTIYLKAPWRLPFDPEDTKPGTFTRADGSRVKVPMMYLKSETGGIPYLPYAKGSGWRAVELPYLGDSLAMTVIVPDDLAAFEAKLTPKLFGQVVAALEGTDVELTFPRFGIETEADLGTLLPAMGMPSPSTGIGPTSPGSGCHRRSSPLHREGHPPGEHRRRREGHGGGRRHGRRDGNRRRCPGMDGVQSGPAVRLRPPRHRDRHGPLPRPGDGSLGGELRAPPCRGPLTAGCWQRIPTAYGRL